MESRIKCIIIEDEPLAVKVLSDYVAQVPFLELEGTFKDAILATEWLRTNEVQLMFLDIHLPKLKGMTFLKTLAKKPAVIFLIYTNFFFLSHSRKLAVMQSEGAGYEFENLLRIGVIYISGIVYSFLSLRILFKYRRNIKNEFSNTERIEFNWLVFLIIGILTIWLIVLFGQSEKLISTSSTIFVILLGYFGITQVNVFGSKVAAVSTVI